jgi:hypothetical protein
MEIGGAYPGGHIEDFVKNVVKPARIYQVDWQRKLEGFILGQGQHMARSWDEYHPLAHVSPEDMGLSHEIILPGVVPQMPDDAIAFIVDSSGSVSDTKMAHLVSFAFACKMSANEMAPKVYVFGADTVVRGEPTELTEETVHELMHGGVVIGGRGGTEFATPINTVCEWALQNAIRLKGIIYATDLGAPVPDEAELHPKCPKLMFAAVPQDIAACDGFKREIARNFSTIQAELVSIESSVTLSLDEASPSSAQNAEPSKSRRSPQP